MKDLWKNGVILLSIIAFLYIIFLRECKQPITCPEEGQVLIKQSVWDSIQALANKPAEVRIDTFWKTKPVVTPSPQPPIPIPIPDLRDTTINNYSDSLINKEINVWVDFKVKGLLIDRNWRYKPILTVVTIDSIIYVPSIVNIPTPVEKAYNSLYGNILFGGNKSSFLFGGGLDLITKKETMIGYQYQRFGEDNFHSVILGGRLKFGKK